MSASTWAVLVEENGKTYVVELVDKQQKIKGLGVFNPHQALHNTPIGQSVVIGQKELKRMPARLPDSAEAWSVERKPSAAKMLVFPHQTRHRSERCRA